MMNFANFMVLFSGSLLIFLASRQVRPDPVSVSAFKHSIRHTYPVDVTVEPDLNLIQIIDAMDPRR